MGNMRYLPLLFPFCFASNVIRLETSSFYRAPDVVSITLSGQNIFFHTNISFRNVPHMNKDLNSNFIFLYIIVVTNVVPPSQGP